MNRDVAAAEFGRIDVDGGHAEQRIAHAEHRDVLAAAQLRLRRSPLDVVELAGEQPRCRPSRGRELRRLRARE